MMDPFLPARRVYEALPLPISTRQQLDRVPGFSLLFGRHSEPQSPQQRLVAYENRLLLMPSATAKESDTAIARRAMKVARMLHQKKMVPPRSSFAQKAISPAKCSEAEETIVALEEAYISIEPKYPAPVHLGPPLRLGSKESTITDQPTAYSALQSALDDFEWMAEREDSPLDAAYSPLIIVAPRQFALAAIGNTVSESTLAKRNFVQLKKAGENPEDTLWSSTFIAAPAHTGRFVREPRAEVRSLTALRDIDPA